MTNQSNPLLDRTCVQHHIRTLADHGQIPNRSSGTHAELTRPIVLPSQIIVDEERVIRDNLAIELVDEQNMQIRGVSESTKFLRVDSFKICDGNIIIVSGQKGLGGEVKVMADINEGATISGDNIKDIKIEMRVNGLEKEYVEINAENAISAITSLYVQGEDIRALTKEIDVWNALFTVSGKLAEAETFKSSIVDWLFRR